jgi:hypothetical protein
MLEKHNSDGSFAIAWRLEMRITNLSDMTLNGIHVPQQMLQVKEPLLLNAINAKRSSNLNMQPCH